MVWWLLRQCLRPLNWLDDAAWAPDDAGPWATGFNPQASGYDD